MKQLQIWKSIGKCLQPVYYTLPLTCSFGCKGLRNIYCCVCSNLIRWASRSTKAFLADVLFHREYSELNDWMKCRFPIAESSHWVWRQIVWEQWLCETNEKLGVSFFKREKTILQFAGQIVSILRFAEIVWGWIFQKNGGWWPQLNWHEKNESSWLVNFRIFISWLMKSYQHITG